MASAAVASCGSVAAAEVAGHVADQRHPRLVGGGAQRVGVAEPLGLGVERVVLARLGRDGLDLLQAVPEHVGGLRQLAGLAAAALEVGGELAPALVGGAVAVEQLQVRRRRRSGPARGAARPGGTAAAGRSGRARRAGPRRARRPRRPARCGRRGRPGTGPRRSPCGRGSGCRRRRGRRRRRRRAPTTGESGGQQQPALDPGPAVGAHPARGRRGRRTAASAR